MTRKSDTHPDGYSDIPGVSMEELSHRKYCFCYRHADEGDKPSKGLVSPRCPLHSLCVERGKCIVRYNEKISAINKRQEDRKKAFRAKGPIVYAGASPVNATRMSYQ